ncbi:MAG: transporter substrate-binding domain-containing protein [Porticoccus sp.]|nr:transporter substrate-binding domain-containing protein [Porticoccus sp.]MBQ0807563.1 transporter substrate-binding domain-containing protein [Porticoccus sp.]
MRNKLAALLCRCLSFVAAVSVSVMCTARTLDEVTASGYIEIAVYRDFPPYSYLDDKQHPSGIDIEIGKLIASRLNVEPRWFWLTADETVEDDLRNAVWKGHALNNRLVADLMMRVPYDREFSYAIDGYGALKNENVVMFGPYQQEQWVLARDLSKVKAVRTLAIFQYQKVGVEIDTLPDFYFSGAFLGRLRKNVVHYPDVFAAFAAFESDDLAAVVGMRSQIEWGAGKQAKNYDIDDDGLGELSKPFWDVGLAVGQANRQLAHTIEELIEQAINSGEVMQLFQQQGLSYRVPALYTPE